MTTETVVLTKTMVNKAIAAGTAFYDATYATDGLMARQQALDESAQGASAIIVDLAQLARKTDKGNTLSYFLAFCSAAESVIKEKGKSENVKDICPHWPVFKSNIKKAIKKGVDVAKHDTLNAITEARKELAREASQPDGEQNDAIASADQPFHDCLKSLVVCYNEATEAERAVLLTDLREVLSHHQTAQGEQAAPDAEPMQDAQAA